MKARVKATGEIKEVELNHIGDTSVYMDKDGVIYNGLYDLDFDVEEKSLPKDEPDYWEKLKHQYAGMAMQGMLSNCEFPAYSTEGYYKHNIANNAVEYATTLINKLKEEPNEGKALLYAVNKTVERTKKEVINKVVNWLGENLHNYAYNVSYLSLYKDLKQAMKD